MKQFFKFMFASCLGMTLSSVLVFIIFISIISASISTSPSVEEINEESLLVLGFDAPIYDREVEDFSSIMIGTDNNTTAIGLTEFIATIKKAKTDDNIKAIMLDLSIIQANGWATIEDIRQALLDFKKSKKKIYAFSDSYSQSSYYLATVADKVYLNPVGSLQLTGIGSQVMYMKDMLNKFDIDVELMRPKNNEYKSAGETYINSKMSQANRKQIKEYISSIWNYIGNNISESRNIDINKLNNDISNLSVFLADEALAGKYVDKLTHRLDLYQEIEKDLKKEDLNRITYKKYRKTIQDIYPYGKDQIAVIYAYGSVMQGKGSDLTIGSEKISKAIRKAADNKRIKAIVLRVNTGGGDAIASEQMTNEIFRAEKIKPVIVSMGDVAASAGYQMSCGATKIVASPISITGSIGVFGVIPNFSRTLKNNLGINFDTVQTHNNSVFLTATTQMSPAAKAVMQRNVDAFYDNFITTVAKGRELKKDYVDSIAKGRVWIGEDAQRLGLVDEIGGLDDAILLAAKEAKIKDYGVVALPKTTSISDKIFEIMEQKVEYKLFARDLGKPYSLFLELRNIIEAEPIQARLPYIIDLQN